MLADQIQVLFLPFLACLMLAGMLVYLGIHVISRKVIFVDIALAQIAALGATVAFLLGYDPRSSGAYYYSLGFAILAAVIFALTRTRHERVPQEAVIGITYATAAAAAILVADISPHGAEHLHDLLAGSIVWVTPEQITKTAILFALIGIFQGVFRKRFLLISLQPEQAYAQGLKVRVWDFLFYLSFGVVITSAVQIGGVLLVFCYLVAPSIFAVMFFDDLRRRLLTGWLMAVVVSTIGLFFSYDRPSGPTIMVGFAVALGLGALVRGIAGSASRPRAVAVTAVSLALVVGGGWGLYQLRSAPAPHAGEGHATVLDAFHSPEHPVGTEFDDLRKALHDMHENVRIKAVADVAATGDPRVLPDLIDTLHDQAAAVREAGALALDQFGNRSALPALKHALNNEDEDDWVLLRMAQAVAHLGDTDGIPVLLELAGEAEGKLVRMQALTALAELKPQVGAVPTDPDGDDGQALLAELRQWWRDNKDRLEWEATTRTFHP